MISIPFSDNQYLWLSRLEQSGYQIALLATGGLVSFLASMFQLGC